MTSGMPFCSATWAIAVVWPESKAPTRSCAPSLISFSARARAVSTFELSIGVHDGQIRKAQVLEDRRSKLDGSLAVPSDHGLHARARQQDTDFQWTSLGAYDGGHGDHRGGGAREQRASIDI